MSIEGKFPAGATDLSSLDDVTITNPLNEQVLIYNSISGMWENGEEVGLGDVIGPDGGVVDNEFSIFSGTTGKEIKNNSAILVTSTPGAALNVKARTAGQDFNILAFENSVGSNIGTLRVNDQASPDVTLSVLLNYDLLISTTGGDIKFLSAGDNVFSGNNNLLSTTVAGNAAALFENSADDRSGYYVSAGTPVGSLTPAAGGYIAADITNFNAYLSAGTTNTDWRAFLTGPTVAEDTGYLIYDGTTGARVKAPPAFSVKFGGAAGGVFRVQPNVSGTSYRAWDFRKGSGASAGFLDVNDDGATQNLTLSSTGALILQGLGGPLSISGFPNVNVDSNANFNFHVQFSRQVTSGDMNFPQKTILSFQDLTAARTVTFNTTSLAVGRIFWIKDETGAANPIQKITAIAGAGVTIDGQSSVDVVTEGYGSQMLYVGDDDEMFSLG